jgi:pilus assembly protein Flp/PilA
MAATVRFQWSSGDGNRRCDGEEPDAATVSNREGATHMRATIRSWFRNEEGATAVEYGVMVALIAVVIITAVVLLGENLSTTFDCTATSIADETNNC